MRASYASSSTPLQARLAVRDRDASRAFEHRGTTTLDPREQLVRREGAHPPCGQLECERDAVEQCAQASYGVRLVPATDAGAHPLGVLAEQLLGAALAQRPGTRHGVARTSLPSDAWSSPARKALGTRLMRSSRAQARCLPPARRCPAAGRRSAWRPRWRRHGVVLGIGTEDPGRPCPRPMSPPPPVSSREQKTAPAIRCATARPSVVLPMPPNPTRLTSRVPDLTSASISRVSTSRPTTCSGSARERDHRCSSASTGPVCPDRVGHHGGRICRSALDQGRRWGRCPQLVEQHLACPPAGRESLVLLARPVVGGGHRPIQPRSSNGWSCSSVLRRAHGRGRVPRPHLRLPQVHQGRDAYALQRLAALLDERGIPEAAQRAALPESQRIAPAAGRSRRTSPARSAVRPAETSSSNLDESTDHRPPQGVAVTDAFDRDVIRLPAPCAAP